MRTGALIRLAVIVCLAAVSTAAFAASAENFKAAYAKAAAANKKAAALKNQWTTTESELNAAQAAATAGKYDEAVAHAEQAETLANASIAQAEEQATAWKQAVIR